jgi:hypothetical protein
MHRRANDATRSMATEIRNQSDAVITTAANYAKARVSIAIFS